MKMVYASAGADLRRIKSFGFDTVCGYFSPAQLDEMLTLDMKCIYAGQFMEHEAICAYYLYDEPDLNNIPILQQELEIAKYRMKTDKPLAIACVENTKRLCSPNFDWYMLDIYYLTEVGRFKKIINYLNLAFSTHFIKVLYEGKKILPIVEIFHDNCDFRYTTERQPFALKFLSYFRDEPDYAVFLWDGGTSGSYVYEGIITREDYQYDAWALNYLGREQEKCWWITSKCLMTIARIVIFVRRILPESWINKAKSIFEIK